MAKISDDSFNRGSNRLESAIPDSISISNQYCVSLASLSAISNLFKKSLSDCAERDSLTFAPIEVPERNNCLDKVLATPGRSSKKLQALMIRIANIFVLSVIGILDIGLIVLWLVSIITWWVDSFYPLSTFDFRLSTWSEATFFGIATLAAPYCYWCANHDPISWLIEQRMGCPYSHVDFVLPSGELLSSSFDTGVAISKLRLDYKRSLLLEAPVERGWSYAETQIGKPYDWSAVLGLGLWFPRDFRNDNAWYCSEIVYESLVRSGLQIVSPHVWGVSPRDLLLSPLLNSLW